MKKYRLVNMGWRNNVYPYYVAVAVCSMSGEIMFLQQVSKNYFSEGWARRWAKTHGITLQN